MAAKDVRVRRVEIVRKEIDYGHKTAGAEIVAAMAAIRGADFRLPLAPEHVSVEIEGVPAAVPNALRRVLKDEALGSCLTFDVDSFGREETTDPFMADEDFVLTRIRMIPLSPQVSHSTMKALRFGLYAVNDTKETMLVYSGDLEITQGKLSEPLFNPTHEIAFLQPGCSLRIDDIYISEGYGRADAAYTVMCRAVSRPLDLEEHPPTKYVPGTAIESLDTLINKSRKGEDVAQPPPEKISYPDSVDLCSGFVESSFVANPRRHLVSAILPAAPAGGKSSAAILLRACGVILERLRYVQSVLDEARGAALRQTGPATTHREANAYFYTAPDASSGTPRIKGVLGVSNETDTIGNLLARAIYETKPDIGYVGYTCIDHEREMVLTVVHAVSDPGEIEQIVTTAIKHSHDVFSKIQQAIRDQV